MEAFVDESVVAVPTRRRRLGEVLLDDGLISWEQLEEALTSAELRNGKRERLGQVIVRLGFADDRAICRALARQLQLEYYDTDLVQVDERAAQTIPSGLAHRHRVVPLRFDDAGVLCVATSDPTNVVALDDIALAAGVRIRLIVAPPLVIDSALRKAYGFDQQAGALIEAMHVEGTGDADEQELARSASDAPVVRLAEGIIVDAIDARASDIHVEPGANDTVVRYRIDGVLHEVMTVPRSASAALISRLKIMAGMDIAERRRPQDGRVRFATARAQVDLRVSTLPALNGETMVMRLLRKGGDRVSLDEVGFSPEQHAAVLSCIERPQGLVLITGPTGSGKTSTLYSFLGELAGSERNIITIEDPVEYELPGVNQTQINDRIGLSFAKALRTVLRQDPDIVMVGEIRDAETAELALQAALTGHLVFATLHTNDAAGAIVRLQDLGVPSFLIASALSMVVAQRLARRICEDCAGPVRPTERQIAQLHIAEQDLEAATFLGGRGCTSCNHTGYRGRVGVVELLTVDAQLREQLATGAPESAVRRAARLGGTRSLREDGLDKAHAGLTTVDEILRITPVDTAGGGACPVCTQTVASEFALCPWCGASLRPDACEDCHRPLERGWLLCPDCGTRRHQPGSSGDRAPLVLVVDDDPSVRAAIGAMLTGDFTTIEAENGQQALEMVAHERPDLVLLDVGMPLMDGWAVTRELRSRPVTMHTPIVLMTGDADPETELRGLRAGADDYLTKPLDLEVLIARLEAVLRRVAT